jgi:uncharacterized protein involved in exopolysaccharide biosynthesis
VTVGGYVIRKSYPAKFKAHALLQVSTQEPKVLYQTGEIESTDHYKRFQNTQLNLVKSQLVLDVVLQDREVAKARTIRRHVDAIAWLQTNLDVKFLADSEVMEIALSGDDADEVVRIVNAVKTAYVNQIVDVERKRQSERYDKLKKLWEQYTEMLKERRQHLRRLAEVVGNDDDPAVVEREKAELFLSHTLWSERLKIRLDHAEAETLLARRKAAAGSLSDTIKKEIAQIEDRIAVLAARQKVIDQELERASHATLNRPQVTSRKLDLSEMREEITMLEESQHKIGAEVEKLAVELGAPPRIRTIQDAAPSKTNGEWSARMWPFG